MNYPNRFRSLSFAALLIPLISCGGATSKLDADSAAQADDIVGGQATSGYSSIGLVFNMDPGNQAVSECSGTIVGPYTVLTAAHCVMAINGSGEAQPAKASAGELFFYTGSNARLLDPSKVYHVTDVVLPGGDSLFPFKAFIKALASGTLNNYDLAVVHVSRSLGRPGLPIARTVPRVGMDLTIVGYGSTQKIDGFGVGTKRFVHVPLTSLFDLAMFHAGTASHGTCSGDSGGPALSNGVIVGITQAGLVNAAGDCVGNDTFVRADAWASFIRSNVR